MSMHNIIDRFKGLEAIDLLAILAFLQATNDVIYAHALHIQQMLAEDSDVFYEVQSLVNDISTQKENINYMSKLACHNSLD